MKWVSQTASLLVGICLLAACAPKGAPSDNGPTVEQLAATIAAATLNTGATGTASAALTPDAPPATPTIAPTLFIHAASAACRSGPGPDFRVIATFPSGATVSAVAKDTTDSYWIVMDPGSHNTCWIQAADATPAGSFDLLPDITPQPVAMPVPPEPSSVGRPNFACDNSTLTTILAWNAPAGPVNGYRVFREGSPVADLPANQTSFTDKIPFVYGSSVQYSIVAYNDAGPSPKRTWTVHCP